MFRLPTKFGGQILNFAGQILEFGRQIFRLTLHIKLVSLKILIFEQFMSQNLSNLVRMPKYGHMVFGSYYSVIFSSIWMKFYIRVQGTTSYKYST